MNNRDKSVIFLLASLLFLAAWSAADIFIMRSNLSRNPASVNENTRILILGDSHTQTSLDPSMIDSSANLSSSNESPFFTYCKAKYVIEKNPLIRTLIVGFSYNNIADVQENAMTGIPLFLDNSFIYMDSQERGAVKEKSFDLFAYYFAKYSLGVPLNFYKNNYLMMSLPGQREKFSQKTWGGFKRMKGANLSKQIDELIAGKGRTDYSISPFLIEYTKKLAEFCREKGIRMYIINTPIHDIFFEKYSPKLVHSYDSAVTELLQENEELIFLDFRRFTQDTSLFYDGEHLNSEGAIIFSPFINNLICGVEDAL